MTWDSSKLKTLRLRLGWSQSELARRLAVPVSYIEKFESAKMKIDLEYHCQLDRMSLHLAEYNKQMLNQSQAEAYMRLTLVNQVSFDEMPKINSADSTKNRT